MASPTPQTLPLLVASAAERFSDRIAVQDGEQQVSYAELDQLRICSVKAFIGAGVQKGDKVVIWAPNMLEWILAAIGLQSVGAVLVPLNNRFQGSEVAALLQRCGAVALFTYTEMEKGEPLALLADCELPALKHRVLLRGEDSRGLSWQQFLALGESVGDADLQARVDAVGPDDSMDMLFTSGTTGTPKGVLCSHSQNIRVFQTWADTVGLRADDNYLVVNPFFHSFGYKAGWLAAIIIGCKILLVMAFDKDAVMAQIERDKVTMLPGAPSMYEMILADPNRDNYDLSSLRLGVTGAAPVSVQLVEDMWNVLGFETVVTAYGMTESTGVISICRPEDPAEIISCTSGRAIDGVEVKCVNPANGEDVALGSSGEIWVRGYNVMQGYFEMPEATADTIDSDGWMRTGDIGVMDDKGYLRITDRLKDMYILNGENVYPAEVENTIRSLEGVSQVAVLGVPKPPQGEVGIAYVVLKPGATLDADAVKAHCNNGLARYKVPFYVEFIEALPLNATGKVDKLALKATALEQLA